ncbi:class D beta-lactamase [Aneurinibacillus sp. REN35]|uniref:class D beta-lactamase n=1 Tax=Aneurinibacillus sp. REN35 TaxID=3237286 RepID=UPI0035293361
MKKAIWLSLLLLCIGAIGFTAQAQPSGKETVKKMKVDEFFADRDGTFVLRDMKNGQTFVYNQKRAQERRTPESTYKVPHALIGLQVKAVQDEYDVKWWDGVVRKIDAWNRDHTLGSGMRNSVVWYYQAMARDIGEKRMKEWVQKLSYGNQDISGGIDQFWLNSSLAISALEQTDFMEKLYKEELPFDKAVMKTGKRMMIQQEEDDYTLYGKTGTRSDNGLGWFVGFVDGGDRSYAFATNVDGTGTQAKNITFDILKKYHIIK